MIIRPYDRVGLREESSACSMWRQRGFGRVPLHLISHQWLLGTSIPPATSRDCQLYYERRLHIASCSIMTRVQSTAKILQYASWSNAEVKLLGVMHVSDGGEWRLLLPLQCWWRRSQITFVCCDRSEDTPYNIIFLFRQGLTMAPRKEELLAYTLGGRVTKLDNDSFLCLDFFKRVGVSRRKNF